MGEVIHGVFSQDRAFSVGSLAYPPVVEALNAPCLRSATKLAVYQMNTTFYSMAAGRVRFKSKGNRISGAALRILDFRPCLEEASCKALEIQSEEPIEVHLLQPLMFYKVFLLFHQGIGIRWTVDPKNPGVPK